MDELEGVKDSHLYPANANIGDGLNNYNQEIRAEIFDVLKRAYVEYENEVIVNRKESHGEL